MISLAPVFGFSALGIPSGDTQNTSNLGTGVPKTRGYPNHCDTVSHNRARPEVLFLNVKISLTKGKISHTFPVTECKE